MKGVIVEPFSADEACVSAMPVACVAFGALSGTSSAGSFSAACASGASGGTLTTISLAAAPALGAVAPSAAARAPIVSRASVSFAAACATTLASIRIVGPRSSNFLKSRFSLPENQPGILDVAKESDMGKGCS
ncbi:hypothetical protein [Gordonibacter sp. An230]|uniref:hypothetical protein n=1 Tax=Gordonibacter sp. An230 TaxID=1965592 RepID=UPI0011208395|nr:hypothetical protein [Gordonibacter sp. An230]